MQAINRRSWIQTASLRSPSQGFARLISAVFAVNSMISCLMGLCVALLHCHTATAQDTSVSLKTETTKPKDKMHEAWWKDRHQAINQRVQEGNVDLLFIGDSITQGWAGAGKSAWEAHFGKLNAVNLGFNGDRTQHVLWRLDNGNINGIHPKAAVLMIGTNNVFANTAEESGAGIAAIVHKLREKLPETKILVLAIFPRGDTPHDLRSKNAKASEIASKLADNKQIFYMDIGDKFLAPDGVISKQIMPDFLHLSPQGYEIWARAIDAWLQEMMK
jgi:lysophospholipase L1-like esterase